MKLRALANTRLVDATAKAKIDALLLDADVISLLLIHPPMIWNLNILPSKPTLTAVTHVIMVTGRKQVMPVIIWVLTLCGYWFRKGEQEITMIQGPVIISIVSKQIMLTLTYNTSSCSVAPPPPHFPAGMPYCLLMQGYWGRDHGDNSGIPPDGRT